jgi:hypothetical protein
MSVSRRRALVCLITSSLLLLSQLHIWGARGCSMCGASCRCASHGASNPCSVRSLGCGGGDGGAAFGSVSPLRAVLVAPTVFAPQVVLDTLPAKAEDRRSDPERPPLDHPPRISC